MPVAGNMILNWIHEDGYSLSEPAGFERRISSFASRSRQRRTAIATSQDRRIESRRERKHTAPWHYADPSPGSDQFNLDRDCSD